MITNPDRQKLYRRYLRLVRLAQRHRDQCYPCRNSCRAVDRRCVLGVRIDTAKQEALGRYWGTPSTVPS